MDSENPNIETLTKLFQDMKWNELRKTAMKNNVKVYKKTKDELINQLVTKITSQEVTENGGSDAVLTETSEHPDDPAMEDQNQPPTVDYESDAKSDATYSVEPNEQDLNDETEDVSKSPTPFRVKKCQDWKTYFAKKHEKLESNQEDLRTMVSRHKERHRSLTRGCPERILALAQPRGADFDFPKHPNTINFQFGSGSVTDLSKVQKPIDASLPMILSTSKSIGELKKSAKILSHDRITSKSGNVILTPKLAEHVKAKETKSYKLRRSSSLGRIHKQMNLDPYAYVDTTIMNNAEYEEYMKSRGRKQ